MDQNQVVNDAGKGEDSLCRALRLFRAFVFVPLVPLLGAGVADLVYLLQRGGVPLLLRRLTWYFAAFCVPCFIVVLAGWLVCRRKLCRRARLEAEAGIEDAVSHIDDKDDIAEGR